MPQTSAQWAELLAPGIREAFSIGYQLRPSLIGQLYNVQTTGRAYEEFLSYGAIAPDAWDEYAKSGRIPEVTFDKGYKTTLTVGEFIVKYKIARTLIEDGKYPQVTSDISGIGDSAALKRETDAMKPFNYCAVALSAGGIDGGDGVPLCDNSHPLSPTKSGSVQDNLDALALSVDNLETVRQKMIAVKDDTGNIAGVQPDLLLYASGLESTAKTIIDTDRKVGSTDNDINPLNGAFRRLALPGLTSSTQWFLVDSIKMKQSLYWFDRIPLSIVPEVGDTTLFSTWIARMRYSYGFRDWRWINRGNA